MTEHNPKTGFLNDARSIPLQFQRSGFFKMRTRGTRAFERGWVYLRFTEGGFKEPHLTQEFVKSRAAQKRALGGLL
jgi:hypothetical protein